MTDTTENEKLERKVMSELHDEINKQFNAHFRDQRTYWLKDKYDLLDEMRKTRNILLESIGLRDKIEDQNKRIITLEDSRKHTAI